MKKIVEFPTYNVSLGEAVDIVKHKLDDDTIATQSKMIAIETVANMETHNGIAKDEIIRALRWRFAHYAVER